VIRPLAAIAVAAFALGAAATPRPAVRHAPSRHGKTAVPRVTVRVEIVSGTPQRQRSYAAHDASKYAADFPQRLVVRIAGVKDPKSAQRRVKFTCVGGDCGFGDPDQPEGGDRDGPDNYIINTKDGKATLHARITHTEPFGTFTVYAEAVPKKGERTVKSGPFSLTMY
jgi:hypothetical protein